MPYFCEREAGKELAQALDVLEFFVSCDDREERHGATQMKAAKFVGAFIAIQFFGTAVYGQAEAVGKTSLNTAKNELVSNDPKDRLGSYPQVFSIPAKSSLVKPIQLGLPHFVHGIIGSVGQTGFHVRSASTELNPTQFSHPKEDYFWVVNLGNTIEKLENGKRVNAGLSEFAEGSEIEGHPIGMTTVASEKSYLVDSMLLISRNNSPRKKIVMLDLDCHPAYKPISATPISLPLQLINPPQIATPVPKNVDVAVPAQADPRVAIEHNNKGVDRMVKLDYKGAVKEFDEAIATNPKYGLAFVNRGLAKEKLADRQGAIFDYSEAIRINPADGSAYFVRAHCEQESGDYRTAIADYTVLMRLHSSSDECVSSYLHQRALAKEKLGDRFGANDDFQREKSLRAKQPK